MIKIRRVERFEDIGKKSWTEILNMSGGNYIFQTYEYTSTWWKYFGQNQRKKELLLLTVENSGSIVAIAPLMITKLPFFNKAVIQFVGTDICDYMDFIIDNNHYEKYLFTIVEYLSKLSFLEIELKYVPEDSKLFKNFDVFYGRNRVYGKIGQVDASPYINLQKGWAEILDRLKKKLKGEISRNERKMQEKGNLEFKNYTKEMPLKKILNNYFYLHVLKWRYYAKQYSQFQYKHWREFITNLSSSIMDKGWLDISYLELNKNMIACHFGFKYNDRFYYYMPTFDPTFAAYSPSKILIMRMMEQSNINGLKEFDFLRGKEPYKMVWTKLTRPIYSILYYSKDVPLRCSGLIYRGLTDSYIKKVKPRLKKIKPFMRSWYKSKGNIS